MTFERGDTAAAAAENAVASGLERVDRRGAAFGAVYAKLAPHTRRLPAWGRGSGAALGKDVARWPATALSDRFHPARAELPVLRRSRRACAQATRRHLLFGVLRGERERRLGRASSQSE